MPRLQIYFYFYLHTYWNNNFDSSSDKCASHNLHVSATHVWLHASTTHIFYLHIQWDDGHFGQVCKHHFFIPGTVRQRLVGLHFSLVFSVTTSNKLPTSPFSSYFAMKLLSSSDDSLVSSFDALLLVGVDSFDDSSEESLWMILTFCKMLMSAQL